MNIEKIEVKIKGIALEIERHCENSFLLNSVTGEPFYIEVCVKGELEYWLPHSDSSSWVHLTLGKSGDDVEVVKPSTSKESNSYLVRRQMALFCFVQDLFNKDLPLQHINVNKVIYMDGHLPPMPAPAPEVKVCQHCQKLADAAPVGSGEEFFECTHSVEA